VKEVRAEQELYVEPLAMGHRDVLGVIVALMALAAIGVSGYVWLNPDLSLSSMLASFHAAKAPPAQAAAAATTETQHIPCPYCGMNADQSEATVSAMWQGGSGSFDSFDCLFNYLKEQHVRLDSATVKQYDAQSETVDVQKAYYLYDTKKTIEGSMPPNVAAFATKDAANKAKAAMGGTLLDYSTLEGKWRK